MLNSIIIISTFILFSIIIPKSRNDNENDKYLFNYIKRDSNFIGNIPAFWRKFWDQFTNPIRRYWSCYFSSSFCLLSGF